MNNIIIIHSTIVPSYDILKIIYYSGHYMVRSKQDIKARGRDQNRI
jgi:hypothetical protein